MNIVNYIAKVLLILLSTLPLLSWANTLIFPFARDNVWQVCQGYNTSNISHIEKLIYSLDFAYGTGNLGSTGCFGNPNGSENKSILAPGSGTISWNGSTNPDITCLKLDSSISNGYGANVNSIMLGHIKSNSQRVGAGKHVNQGEIIGITCSSTGCTTVGGYSHIHMGIYTSSDCSGTTVPLGKVFGAGFDFPNNGNVRQWHGTQISVSTSPPPGTQLHHFDGAGSLIAPSQSCWGCNKDEAKMHAHPQRLSTVAFQWLKTAQCDHIDIETTPSLGNVIIKTKTWDSHLTQSAYKLSLPGSVPASGMWNTTSVASTAPISSAVSVIARCKTASDASKGSRTTLANDLVALDSNYYWTGNGSLISSAGTGTGGTEDWAVTFNSKNSLTVFQWEAKAPSCDQLTLIDGAGATVSLSGDNGVMIKQWNADTWSQNLCTKLPCTTTAPGQGYYLLKIKSASNAVPSGQIKATCK